MICMTYAEILGALLGGFIGAILCGFIQAWCKHRKAKEK